MAPTGTMRKSLAGRWRRAIDGHVIDTVPVPGGYRPVGACVLEHTFAHPWPDAPKTDRMFLVTDFATSSNGRVGRSRNAGRTRGLSGLPHRPTGSTRWSGPSSC